MEEVWKRITGGHHQQRPDIIPGDRDGARLYYDFKDCLDEHKYHVILGVNAITVPWSVWRKNISPFVIGAILSLLPDLLYANWRCDDRYKAFKAHCNVVQAAMEQHQQLQQQQHQQRQQPQQQPSS